MVSVPRNISGLKDALGFYSDGQVRLPSSVSHCCIFSFQLSDTWLFIHLGLPYHVAAQKKTAIMTFTAEQQKR